MNETIMTVSGNLVSDVDYKVTGRGDPLARFRVASTVSRYDRATGRWADGETTYWNVTAWRRAAENARASLAKGMPIVLQAKVRQRTVDREVPGASGTTMSVTFTDLEAMHFGLDLSRCRAVFQRAPIGPQTDADVQQFDGAGDAGVTQATSPGPSDPANGGSVVVGASPAPDGAAA